MHDLESLIICFFKVVINTLLLYQSLVFSINSICNIKEKANNYRYIDFLILNLINEPPYINSLSHELTVSESYVYVGPYIIDVC